MTGAHLCCTLSCNGITTLKARRSPEQVSNPDEHGLLVEASGRECRLDVRKAAHLQNVDTLVSVTRIMCKITRCITHSFTHSLNPTLRAQEKSNGEIVKHDAKLDHQGLQKLCLSRDTDVFCV